ncbi:MAG: hydroxymethylbilane synthase [Bacteroidia bacterium]|nr:hydroxymethylbilane synthase [Bacteroidia bacterium]NNM23038.1 hydroxymethylbilane synthase [Flavobacteriaceae bacterium]
MSRTLRIGTRDSELALFQATTVGKALEDLGFSCSLVPVKSTGDLELNKPLYELGITGIFTKTLDQAMLNNKVDIAVHSLKDVPTLLPKGIVQTAVLERASSLDVLVPAGNPDFKEDCIIATGSLRRKAQWLHRYPHHRVVGLRGNVNTRLKKLADSDWSGAIFARAGLERIQLLPENSINLNWMIPAPAQGAMAIMARTDDDFAQDAATHLNHAMTQTCTSVERKFLRVLEGGCSAPIGALATVTNEHISFKGALLSLDGQQKIEVEREAKLSDIDGFGEACAKEILDQGGAQLMQEIKASTP